jgi:hypothetical protein
LAPWVLNSVIDGINSHRIVQMGALGLKSGLKKRIRTLKMPLPPAYYTVPMKAQVLKKSARRTMKRILDMEWSHRWDVRGHECAKIGRGPLPLIPKKHKDLVKRGYTVFTVDKLNPRAVRVMLTKGAEPRQPNEWIAVKTWWRDPCIKGPQDKPYIPSVHKPMQIGEDDG